MVAKATAGCHLWRWTILTISSTLQAQTQAEALWACCQLTGLEAVRICWLLATTRNREPSPSTPLTGKLWHIMSQYTVVHVCHFWFDVMSTIARAPVELERTGTPFRFLFGRTVVQNRRKTKVFVWTIERRLSAGSRRVSWFCPHYWNWCHPRHAILILCGATLCVKFGISRSKARKDWLSHLL